MCIDSVFKDQAIVEYKKNTLTQFLSVKYIYIYSVFKDQTNVKILVNILICINKTP